MNTVTTLGHDVVIASDGRYDSPGHSARWISYSMLDTVRHTV